MRIMKSNSVLMDDLWPKGGPFKWDRFNEILDTIDEMEAIEELETIKNTIENLQSIIESDCKWAHDQLKTKMDESMVELIDDLGKRNSVLEDALLKISDRVNDLNNSQKESTP